MSKFKQGIVVTGLLALGIASAFASDASEWIMKPNQGYVIDKNGHVAIIELRADSAMTARAQEVPEGTTFFMNDGRVMMYYDRGNPPGFFDR
jgi:hypothetical protein